MSDTVHVIKLGGSLLDLEDLVQRVEVFRAACVTGPAVMVIGGADAADLVRAFDRRFALGEVAGHWLAVRAMQFNTHVVAAALRGSRLVCDADDCAAAWRDGAMAVVEPIEWLRREETRGVAMPHRWTFTSDSIAAHVGTELKAKKLWLLKSTLGSFVSEARAAPHPGPLPAPGMGEGVGAAVAAGLVDADFEEASREVPAIEIVNLRHESFAQAAFDAAARCVLR